MDSQFISIGNTKRKFKGRTRHYYSICWVCKDKKKNIILHYKKYHPVEFKKWENRLKKLLLKGEVGELYRVRFVEN